MSLKYGFIDTLKLLLLSCRYKIFFSIIISSIIFSIILYINKNRKITKYLILTINILLIILISHFYINDILTFQYNNPINNIYFYFANTIIYLIVLSIKKEYKLIDFIFYGLSLINILFSLFMTNYLHNITAIVIANIFPMIKFGNIIYIIYYVVLLAKLLVNKINKSY